MRPDRHRPRIRGVSPEVRLAARRLRAEMTAAERLLWQALRRRAVDNLRFRRQHAVGSYVLDFCCPEVKLAVELDGGIHDDDDQAAHDAERTHWLEAYGYRIMRVRNEDVTADLSAVIERIRQAGRAS